MELEYNMQVYTADGKDAGHLSRVVIDPETQELTHIIIRKGVLNKEERVIHTEEIAATAANRITLLCNSDEMETKPLFEVAEQVPLRETGSGEGVFTESLGSLHQPPGPVHYITTEVKRTLPDELIVLEEGTPVISVDDERVGNLDHVLTHPESNQVEYFVVSKGWLLKERKRIPLGWVHELGETAIDLSVRSRLVVSLPPYEQA